MHEEGGGGGLNGPMEVWPGTGPQVGQDQDCCCGLPCLRPTAVYLVGMECDVFTRTTASAFELFHSETAPFSQCVKRAERSNMVPYTRFRLCPSNTYMHSTQMGSCISNRRGSGSMHLPIPIHYVSQTIN